MSILGMCKHSRGQQSPCAAGVSLVQFGLRGRVFRRGAICVSTEYIVFHQIGRKVKRKEMGMAK